MRTLTTIVIIALTTPVLLSCDQQNSSVPGIDPKLGFGCFETHRSSLPPGTQYEGIKEVVDNRLYIKVMNGVEVTTIECELTPDGKLRNNEK